MGKTKVLNQMPENFSNANMKIIKCERTDTGKSESFGQLETLFKVGISKMRDKH